jgi:uncharacterized protein involved in cysteine biosynthesis
MEASTNTAPRTIPSLLDAPKAALASFWEGLTLCVLNAKVRKIVLLPWLVGMAIAVVVFLIGAFYIHPLFTAAAEMTLGSGSSMFHALISWAVGLALYGFLTLWSLCLILMLFAFFQDEIAAAVLREKGVALARDEYGMTRLIVFNVLSFGRAILVLLFILPILAIAFICSLTGVLAPIGFLLMGWAVAIQCFDPCYEVLDVSFSTRCGRAFSRLYTYLWFGTLIMVVSFIPFSLLFVPPVAIASAAVLAARVRLQEPTQQIDAVITAEAVA